MKRLIYIDESGSASFSAVSIQTNPWLILSAVITTQPRKRVFQRRIMSLKNSYFGISGQYFPLHFYDLLKGKDFWQHLPLTIRTRFVDDYLKEVRHFDPDLILIVVNKTGIQKPNVSWYEFAMALVLERLQWIYRTDEKRIYCEQRQHHQNQQLQKSYKLYHSRGVSLSPGQKKTFLRNFNPGIVFLSKKQVVAPLELADAIAYWCNLTMRGSSSAQLPNTIAKHFFKQLGIFVTPKTLNNPDNRFYKEFP